MFAFLKKKLEQKKEKDQGFHYAQAWRDNAPLQRCFDALRSSFTVAQAYHQEAVEATVAIAVSENNWTECMEIPADFLDEKCYIFWNDPTLPALLCFSAEVLENLREVTAVAHETFLVSETMDRIIHWRGERHLLYSIT